MIVPAIVSSFLLGGAMSATATRQTQAPSAGEIALANRVLGNVDPQQGRAIPARMLGELRSDAKAFRASDSPIGLVLLRIERERQERDAYALAESSVTKIITLLPASAVLEKQSWQDVAEWAGQKRRNRETALAESIRELIAKALAIVESDGGQWKR